MNLQAANGFFERRVSMMRQLAKKQRLALELLEARLTPTIYGQQWLNSQNLTVSFVPNGTQVGNTNSNLLDFLSHGPTQAVGEEEILRALQTWAVNANINIGLVNEQGGIALGAPGLIQGDSRFGDIRVAGSTGLTSDVVATGAPFNWSLGTSSGDVVFNTNQNIGVNPNGTGSQYDLFSVALHEAGHVFGFADESTDPSSVMYTTYQGPVTNLSATDVANLHTLYGAAAPDANQATGGNGTFAKATPVAFGTNDVVSGDLTSIGQVEYFRVTVPAKQNLVVTLHTSGYSLLIPNLDVFDANGNLLKSNQPDQAWTKDATVNFGGQPTDQTYYIRVSSPSTNVFGMGGFQLELGNANPPNPNNPTVNQDKTANQTMQTATVLAHSSVAVNDYSYFATMKDTQASHFYQVTAPITANNASQAMLVSVMSLQNSNNDPGIHIYDAQGNLLPYQVLTNDGLNYMVQLTNIAPGSSYYIELTQQSPNGKSNPGDYHVCVNFSLQPAAATPAVASNTLNKKKPTDSGSLVVGQAALVHFALAANAANSSIPLNLTMTITDSTGRTVFTLTTAAGQPPATLNYYLGAGTYTVTYKVSLGSGAQSNSAIPDVLFELDAGISSDPQGPAFTSSPGSPTGGSGTGTGAGGGGQLTYNGSNTGGVTPFFF
jgi:Matrixin/Bacterial pre-peptidase C-terminal domain